MRQKKILPAILAAMIIINMINTSFFVVMAEENAFELLSTNKSDALGGTIYRYKHKKTGAEVVYNDNRSEKREFVIGFKTPPVDNKGANHVLEHALFCGSEKYPTKNIMHYIQNGTSSLILNGVTSDDCTYYLINTRNETEYYNMIDVYMNGIFHPLFLTDENIFRQQGIRIEYANGRAQYNGVVYNELRIKNLNTEENSVNFLADQLYRGIYGNTTPAFSAGGELDAIKELTYEDLLRVYNTFYIPSNSMTYLSGNQDINRTLDILDDFFSEIGTEAPHISFEDTRKIPAKKIQEYNVNANTKTVDIGFMSSGVAAAAGSMERYARDILYEIIRKKMETETECTNTYTSGGNTGGISNLALILSEIPVEKKDEVIGAYTKVLDALSEEGIDESDIDTYLENQKRNFYAGWDNIFNGLMYHDDPLVYTEINSICDHLKSHKEYFAEILKKYFTENPCSVIVVSGNGLFGSEDSAAPAKDLEKIKRETAEFQRWNDAGDDPSVIEKIPFLTIEEVRTAPEKTAPKYEEQEALSFYYTEKDNEEACLYFPLEIKDEDFDYVQLMHYFLEEQARKSGIDFYTALMPLENAENPQEMNPHFLLAFSPDNAAESVKKAIAFLQSEDTWSADDLAAYIKTAPQKILDSYYDPYFLSSELKDSALSASGRFSYLIPLNTFVKGSPHYYYFLQELNPDDASEIARKLKTLTQELIIDSRPVASYTGEAGGYNEFKNLVSDLFSESKARKSADLRLPLGCYSAATVTRLADANHFMLAAVYDGYDYSGKMAVLGKVLSTKYITPTMRGKHGAYGCNISFREDEMVSAVAGLADIDLALEIWQGMGDYLRNLKMTQNELDSFIVSAVQEYDEWDYTASENGADFALRKKSANDCEKIRNEMLAVTVEDLWGYADFVDDLVAQNRVFAVLGKDAAENADFEFDYYADADTLMVTPGFKKNPSGYISGKTDTDFAPDEPITRAETAVMISRLLADTRRAENESPFSDVMESAWYADAVLSLCEKNVLSGYDDDTFLPDQNISRGELAAVLSQFLFKGSSVLDRSYADLSETDWYYTPMAKMINDGFIAGYEDGTLHPNESVTRAEAVAVINRILGIEARDNEDCRFEDLSRTHWAYGDIVSATE